MEPHPADAAMCALRDCAPVENMKNGQAENEFSPGGRILKEQFIQWRTSEHPTIGCSLAYGSICLSVQPANRGNAMHWNGAYNCILLYDGNRNLHLLENMEFDELFIN